MLAEISVQKHAKAVTVIFANFDNNNCYFYTFSIISTFTITFLRLCRWFTLISFIRTCCCHSLLLRHTDVVALFEGSILKLLVVTCRAHTYLFILRALTQLQLNVTQLLIHWVYVQALCTIMCLTENMYVCMQRNTLLYCCVVLHVVLLTRFDLFYIRIAYGDANIASIRNHQLVSYSYASTQQA